MVGVVVVVVGAGGVDVGVVGVVVVVDGVAYVGVGGGGCLRWWCGW